MYFEELSRVNCRRWFKHPSLFSCLSRGVSLLYTSFNSFAVFEEKGVYCTLLLPGLRLIGLYDGLWQLDGLGNYRCCS